MSFHTKRSPSQAHRFLVCAGTFAICDTLPDHQRNQSGLAAQLGTAAHGVIEHCLKNNTEPEDLRGRIVELIGDEEEASVLRASAKAPGAGRTWFEIDSDMIEGAEVMTHYVRKRCKELVVDESEIQLETRTNPLPDRDDTSGTADVTIQAWPTLLEVVDYKNGYNIVEHEDNEQLMAYLLGKALESDWSYENYRVTVVQPNASHAAGRVRPFEATKKELLAFQKSYRAGIERCEVAETEFGLRDNKVDSEWAHTWLKAGDHCLFCDAQAVCPARLKLAQDDAVMDFKDNPEDLQEPRNEETVSRILLWAPRMEALIRAATLFAQRSMEAGFEVPEHKLVRGKSNRVWRDGIPESKIVAALVGRYKINPKLLHTAPKLISGPAAEKLIHGKKQREEFADKYLFKPDGRLTVTHISDSREAVECSVADDFAEPEFG